MDTKNRLVFSPKETLFDPNGETFGPFSGTFGPNTKTFGPSILDIPSGIKRVYHSNHI
ncbi:hypothetical protein ABEV54_14225 [Peribacillus psychrosaccharolyticus]|uniref:hypothetical protein n=1 Tax=Peribacillus psychrosaccharolyticus TaxID=1407 RepID=UPI003D265EC4